MPRAEPSRIEWTEFCSGPNSSVWIHERCKKEIDDIPQKDRAKIQACMEEMYCTMESVGNIPKSKFNRNEGRHGSEKRLVQAFKSFQGRVYGVEGSIDGKRTFFASTAEIKKDNRADPAVLKRAAERISSVSEIKGAEV